MSGEYCTVDDVSEEAEGIVAEERVETRADRDGHAPPVITTTMPLIKDNACSGY